MNNFIPYDLAYAVKWVYRMVFNVMELLFTNTVFLIFFWLSIFAIACTFIFDVYNIPFFFINKATKTNENDKEGAVGQSEDEN